MKSVFSLCTVGLVLASSVQAALPDYSVDSAFSTDRLNAQPICVSVDEKDQVYVLLSSGTIQVMDSEGKSLREIKPDTKSPASAMALSKGKTYLLTTNTKMVEVESRGRKVNRATPIGVVATVLGADGKKESEFELPGVLSARDAHFIGDQLAVGDLESRKIVIYDVSSSTPKEVSTIDKEFRLCCGIFDFCPSVDGKGFIVANLGAFKVQSFRNKRKVDEFGERGEALKNFHGCCNPVNVADLGDDALITVEKSPTRVKLCDSKGKQAKEIPGLGELVQGCSTIPVAVDSKGGIYLASATRGCIVKCSPAVPRETSGKPSSGGLSSTTKPAFRELSPPRLWTNKAGRTVQGCLVAFDAEPGATSDEPVLVRNNSVRLLTKGKTFEIQLSQLNEADLKVVEELRAELEKPEE